MKRNILAVCAVLAAILALSSGASAWPGSSARSDVGANPPTNAAEVEIPEGPTTIDSVTPMLVPAAIEELLRQAGEALKNNIQHPVEAGKEVRAIQLFKLAESCRGKGEFEKARTCYQQVHILAPTSRLGRLAMDRLSEVEERMRESAEEQETLPVDESPQQTFRNIRRNTIPLGLVELPVPDEFPY